MQHADEADESSGDLESEGAAGGKTSAKKRGGPAPSMKRGSFFGSFASDAANKASAGQRSRIPTPRKGPPAKDSKRNAWLGASDGAGEDDSDGSPRTIKRESGAEASSHRRGSFFGTFTKVQLRKSGVRAESAAAVDAREKRMKSYLRERNKEEKIEWLEEDNESLQEELKRLQHTAQAREEEVRQLRGWSKKMKSMEATLEVSIRQRDELSTANLGLHSEAQILRRSRDEWHSERQKLGEVQDQLAQSLAEAERQLQEHREAHLALKAKLEVAQQTELLSRATILQGTLAAGNGGNGSGGESALNGPGGSDNADNGTEEGNVTGVDKSAIRLGEAKACAAEARAAAMAAELAELENNLSDGTPTDDRGGPAIEQKSQLGGDQKVDQKVDQKAGGGDGDFVHKSKVDEVRQKARAVLVEMMARAESEMNKRRVCEERVRVLEREVEDGRRLHADLAAQLSGANRDGNDDGNGDGSGEGADVQKKAQIIMKDIMQRLSEEVRARSELEVQLSSLHDHVEQVRARSAGVSHVGAHHWAGRWPCTGTELWAQQQRVMCGTIGWVGRL